MLHNKPARSGPAASPTFSPTPSQPIVLARRERSPSDRFAMTAPHAGRKAALPRSSTTLAEATPTSVGARRYISDETTLATLRVTRTSRRLTLSDSQPNSGPAKTIVIDDPA